MRVRLATLGRLLLLAALTILVLGALAGIAVAEVEATTWSEYARRVSLAHDAVDDAADELLDSSEGTELAARINTLLPAREVVVLAEDEGVVVDNSLLRAMVANLDSSDTPAERASAVTDLGAHLASLQSAVGEPGEDVASDPELLDEILAEREPDTSAIQAYLAELIERALAWFERTFGSFGGETAVGFIDWVVRGIVFAIAVVLVYIAFRVIQRLRRSAAERDLRIADAGGAPVVAAAEGLPDDALAHADALAAAGEFREAVRALYGGAARSLVEAGAVRQTRTLTSGELLSAVGPALPEVRQTLTHLTALFEAAWYGHRDPGETGFAQARADHAQIVSALTHHSSGGEAA